MIVPVSLLTLFYQLAGFALTLYGCFLLVSILLYNKHRSRHDWPLQEIDAPAEWPMVTVQLPIYNEPQVALRVVRAVAALRYPIHKLQIQVLDDSTDSTSAVLAQQVTRLRKRGLRIDYIHRRHRQGYKAGALAAGLKQATGEYIAIFDADFVPEPDWLQRALPALIQHPQLAFVQTRWEHLNWSQNALTAAQSLALDGHFVIEQQARSAAGYLQNFNGSGGIWRRAAIDSVGGWSSDTVTEDLDLSYRVQLAGWRGAYVNAITAPAEVPPLMSGYKRQQLRWAKGSMQTIRKLAGTVLRSSLPMHKRVYALFHLGGYAMHLPLLLLLLLSLPLAVAPPAQISMPLLGTFSSLISVAPFVMYGLAQAELRGRAGWQRLWALPSLALVSLGLSPAIGKAVLTGLWQRGGTFERTPKQGDGPRILALPDHPFYHQLWPEIFTWMFALLTLGVIMTNHQWQLAPLPALYALGSTFVLAQSGHELRLMRHRPQQQLIPLPKAYPTDVNW